MARDKSAKDFTQIRLKDQQGVVLWENDKIIEQWKYYYDKLLNEENPRAVFGDGVPNEGFTPHITPFTLALLIRSETGFAPMRAFTLHQLIRINDLIRIKLNHLLEVVSHRFSLLWVLIASVDATGTRIKAEQI